MFQRVGDVPQFSFTLGRIIGQSLRLYDLQASVSDGDRYRVALDRLRAHIGEALAAGVEPEAVFELVDEVAP